MDEVQNKLEVFQEKEIRRIWHDGEWWFAVSDVVQILTDSKDVKQYIKRIRSRDSQLNSNWGTICTPLQMIAKERISNTKLQKPKEKKLSSNDKGQ